MKFKKKREEIVTFSIFDVLENMIERVWYDTSHLRRVGQTLHCVSFPCPGLTVRKNGAVVPEVNNQSELVI